MSSKKPPRRIDEAVSTVTAQSESYWTLELAQLREVVRLAEGMGEKATVTIRPGEEAPRVGERYVRQIWVREALAAEDAR